MSAKAKVDAVELDNCASLYQSHSEWMSGLMTAILKLSKEDVDDAFSRKGAGNFYTVMHLAAIGEYLSESAVSQATAYVQMARGKA